MNRALASITGLSLVLLLGACGGSSPNRSQSGSGGSSAGSGGTSGGTGSGGASSGSGGRAGGSGGAASGGTTAGASGGITGVGSGGTSGSGSGGKGDGGTGAGSGGATGTASGGAGGAAAGSGGATSTGGSTDAAWPKPAQPPADEDGSQLWLRYPKIALASKLAEYQAAITHVVNAGSSATLQLAQAEVVKGLSGLLGQTIATADAPTGDGAVVLGTPRLVGAGERAGARQSAGGGQ